MTAQPEPTTAPPTPPAAVPGGSRRPRLRPAVRTLWRDASTLQLGRTSPRAAVLAGLDPATRAVLPLLDGSREVAEVLAEADRRGCDPDRAAELLALLAGAGLLDDPVALGSSGVDLEPALRDRLAPDLASLDLVSGGRAGQAVARRRAACIRVVGAGRVGALAAALLGAAGVGAVEVVDDGPARASDSSPGGLATEDAGRSRAAAAAERARATGAPVRAAASRCPDLVLLAPVSPASLEDDRADVPRGVPHLLAEVRDTVGVVGPLVLPGQTACLRCLDLARTDLDPGWPALAAQLATPVRAVVPCDAALATAVAATACLQVLAVVDGPAVEGAWPPPTADGTLELALPDWRWRRRSWQRHPDCSC